MLKLFWDCDHICSETAVVILRMKRETSAPPLVLICENICDLTHFNTEFGHMDEMMQI